MRTRTGIILLLTFLLPQLVVACTGERQRQPVVFSVGGAPAELAFWDELVKEFEHQSGIKVELLRQPADTDQQRQGLIIALKAGIANPDVFLMDVAWLGLFEASGWLAPLADVDRSPFFPRILKQVDIHHGQLLALPVDMDAGLLYYRRDLLNRYDIAGPPPTWPKLLATALKVQKSQRDKNPDFYGFVWQGAQYEGLITSFLDFAGEAGGFIQRNGRILLDVPANRRALAFMHDLIWKYKISPPDTYTTMREEEVRRTFQEGDALYERNWPYAWSLHQQEGSPVRGVTGVAGIPAPAGGRAAPCLGGWHVGISRYSDVKPEALAFVRYLTSYEAQKKMVLALGWNPGRQDLYDDPEVIARAPYLKQLRQIILQARPRPLVPFYPQISAIAQRHLNAALAGTCTPKEALVLAQRDIAALLARYGLKRSPGAGK
ncbi:MAG: ABC transporter substrate-binding protein [Deltaproteobacteria bacterium]